MQGLSTAIPACPRSRVEVLPGPLALAHRVVGEGAGAGEARALGAAPAQATRLAAGGRGGERLPRNAGGARRVAGRVEAWGDGALPRGAEQAAEPGVGDGIGAALQGRVAGL